MGQKLVDKKLKDNVVDNKKLGDRITGLKLVLGQEILKI